MGLQVRTIDPSEVEAFVASASVAFLEIGNHDEEAAYARHIEPGRAWVALDGDRVVGNACTFTRDLTVPAGRGGGCPVVPFAAVSGVGVHPTHRRRGLLRRLMAAMMDDARRRGEALAALEASESSIYGRFGYGHATTIAETAIDTSRSQFSAPAPALEVRLVDAAEAAKVLPDLHDRCRRRRAGEASRDEATWANLFADPASQRGGGSALYYAVAEGGYAIYRAHDASANGLYGARLEVRALYGTTPDVEAALWRFLLDIDLVREVTARPRPVDDHLKWRLADPRQLRTTTLRDYLWVRVLDVGGALEARGYQHPGTLVIAVHGEGEVAGSWVLEAEPAGASCRRARAGKGPDLTLGITDLGAVYLGGVAPSTLAQAGRVSEERPGALLEADRVFSTTPAPFSGTGF